MTGKVVDFFTKTAVSAARSLLLSEVKGGVKSFINKKRAKTISEVHQEMMSNLGYTTSHYVVNKAQEIVYKPSAVFLHEWLTHTPSLVSRLIKDEETGRVYFNNCALSNADKLAILNKFVEQTKIQSPALTGYFDNAVNKLFEVSDINAANFKKHFAGWNHQNESIINQFLSGCFGIDDQLSKKLFRKWIIGAARRITQPGSSLDGCLLLRSAPGTGKTSWFRQLLPEPFDNRATDIYCNIKNAQKFVENITRYSIVNFDELSPLELPKTAEIFKQLLTSQKITVRLPWRRDAQQFSLRAAFGATTNKEQFISDAALSRRLWIIELPQELKRLNFDYFHANKEALWKEALYCAEQKESCFLSPEEQAEVEQHNAKFMLNA